MIRSRIVLTGALLLSALIVLSALSGCRTTLNPRVTDIQLSVLTSSNQGTPPDSLEFRGVVKNAGTTSVWHCEGCGCGNGITLSVLGPDGLPVLIQDPNRIGPACPDGTVPLGAGEKISRGDFFTGTLYVANARVFPTPTYPAPSGTYTVVARFVYETTARQPPFTTLERRTTFEWTSPAAIAR